MREITSQARFATTFPEPATGPCPVIDCSLSWRRTEARSWPDFSRWQVVSGSLARVSPRQLEGDCRRPKMMPPGIEAGGEAGGSEGEGGMGDNGGQDLG